MYLRGKIKAVNALKGKIAAVPVYNNRIANLKGNVKRKE